MFTSIKEYKKQLNTLNPEQKLKHIDNTMNELKELYYSDSSNIIDMSNILRNLKELYAIRPSTEQLNSTPIDPSVKFLINIANKSNKSNESNESSDDDLEVPHLSEKSSHYFNFLKYTMPAHYDGVFDSKQNRQIFVLMDNG